MTSGSRPSITSLELVIDRSILFRAVIRNEDLYNSLRAVNMDLFEARQDTAFGDPDKFSLVVPGIVRFDYFKYTTVGHFLISGMSPKANWRPTCGRSSINDELTTDLARSQQVSVARESALAQRAARQVGHAMSLQVPTEVSPTEVLGKFHKTGHMEEPGTSTQVKFVDALRVIFKKWEVKKHNR